MLGLKEMAKVVYTVRFEVRPGRAKLIGPGLIGYHWTTECLPKAASELQNYIEALQKLIQKIQHPALLQTRIFDIQNVFIDLGGLQLEDKRASDMAGGEWLN